jgi:hypothetical protein
LAIRTKRANATPAPKSIDTIIRNILSPCRYRDSVNASGFNLIHNFNY